MGYLGIMLIMRYHDDGGALVVQLGKQMHHLGTILGIEVTIGSSARMMLGLPTTARAIATRCC